MIAGAGGVQGEIGLIFLLPLLHVSDAFTFANLLRPQSLNPGLEWVVQKHVFASAVTTSRRWRGAPVRGWKAGAIQVEQGNGGGVKAGRLLSEEQREMFWRDGFVFVPNLLTCREAESCRERYELLFAGKFDTGLYPDEWHWRQGISMPDKVREICNGWKSDSVIGSMVLDERFGRLGCELMKWQSARVAQDSLIWKPPGAGPVTYHQDAPYISNQFLPAADNSITIWCALDDADEETGVVEYARGSHLWASSGEGSRKGAISGAEFHGAKSKEDYMKPLCSALATAGKAHSDLDIVRLQVPAGSAVIHHQDTWHGSGENISQQRMRRALAVHMLRGDVAFTEKPGYIYGRYKIGRETFLHESFFPTTFSQL